MDWHQSVIDRMRVLHAENLTFSEIAAKLNHEFNLTLTRNACIGKGTRIGLGGRTVAPAERAKRAHRPSVRVQKIIPASVNSLRVVEVTRVEPEPLRLADVQPLHLSIIDLDADHCRYPYGDGPFTFCGCTVAPGRPYCLPHAKLCEGERRVFEHRSRAQQARRARERTAA